jgi:hypothetical protein
MSCIPRFIIEFVNFDADIFYFLGNILPEGNPALMPYQLEGMRLICNIIPY